MAARGALPLPPLELATVLFALMHDPDAEVKNLARESLEGLPDTVMDAVLEGDVHPAILSHLARTFREDENRCEKIALNPAADDSAIAFLAGLPSRRLVEIVSNNQERMLRTPEIVDALGANPLTGRATIERVLALFDDLAYSPYIVARDRIVPMRRAIPDECDILALPRDTTFVIE